MRHWIAWPRATTSALGVSERLTRRDPNLLAHEIDPTDQLGHGVLDLKPCVHLQEVERAVRREQELHRTGPDVVDRRRHAHRHASHLFDQRVGARRRGRRRFLHDLLMPSLDRTVTLEEMHGRAVRVSEHLNLDVARLDDRLLDVDCLVAERVLGLAPCAVPCARQLIGSGDETHPLAAASSRCFQHDRVADRVRDRSQLLERRERRAGNHGNSRRHHPVACRRLIAHRLHRARGWSDQCDRRLLQRAGERGVLAQKAVPRMHGARAGLLRGGDDALDDQIALATRRGTDRDRFVGHPHVKRATIRLAIDRDRADSHLPERPDDPDRDLSAVRHEHFVEER